MFSRYAKHILYTFLTLAVGTVVLAQETPKTRKDKGPVYGRRIEKKAVELDSAALARRDSLHVADSLFKIDSIALQGKSSLEAPAFSAAKDSIVEVFSDGHRLIYYYGEVEVKYQDMTLTADYMEYDMNTGTVYARGTYDTLDLAWRGKPVMKQGNKTYDMDELRYNFGSGKARITNMVTNESDGIIYGRNIKMAADHSINMTHGKYTVCDCEHPHYWLELSAAKVLTKPSQKTVFGPAHIVVEDVHIPLGLPFGFVPKRPERATGLLMPTFGEENSRGFYMRDLGMYFVFGDFFDLSVTGDLYTLGSWAIDVNSRYKVNYMCNGNFGINYSKDVTGEKNAPDYRESTNFGLKWSHSQDSKAHPGSTFSASVNFSSPKNNTYNSVNVTEALQNQVSSSISYSKNWNGKLSLSINALHSQNSKDSSYSFTLPNLTFNVSTFYPFKRKHRVGKEKAYEKFSLGYSTSLSNKINFYAKDFNLSKDFLNKFQSSMTHNFSIGLPSFTLLKYLTFNPTLSYGQQWYFRQYNPVQDEETKQMSMVQGDNFSAFGIMQTYSGAISMSTRVYGTFNFGTYRKVQAIRHVLTPSISFNLSPEQNTDFNGYRTMHYIDKQGNEQEYRYNIYTGSTGWGSSKAATMNISLGNNLEAKVRDYADTTGKGSKKVKLIDQFNISTGYNFIADSLNMREVSMTISTSLFNKVSLNASVSLDPYAMAIKNNSAVKVNTFAVNAGQGLLRLSSVSGSASYSLSGKGAINGNDGKKDNGTNGGGGSESQTPSKSSSNSGVSGAADYYRRIYYHPITGEYIPGGWLYYTNPNVPWSINLSANVSYRQSYTVDKEIQELIKSGSWTATLSFSGSIKLTPKLNINLSSGFDFISSAISTTQLSATYDLHCFNISVSWVPTGTWKSYSFRIAANASALADLLKYNKSSSYWDQ